MIPTQISGDNRHPLMEFHDRNIVKIDMIVLRRSEVFASAL